MLRSRMLIAFAGLAILVGCVKHRYEYTPPTRAYEVQSTIFVEKPRDEVWKKVLAGLSSNFFVINNMDKESGFINISYSGDPTRYVDCGELYYYFENVHGPREYRFPAAAPNANYVAVANGNNAINMYRTMSLEGRINLLIQQEGAGTKVTTTVKYLLTKRMGGQSFTGQMLAPSTETITFNSGPGGAAFPAGTECRPTGVLESEILALLK